MSFNSGRIFNLSLSKNSFINSGVFLSRKDTIKKYYSNYLKEWKRFSVTDGSSNEIGPFDSGQVLVPKVKKTEMPSKTQIENRVLAKKKKQAAAALYLANKNAKQGFMLQKFNVSRVLEQRFDNDSTLNSLAFRKNVYSNVTVWIGVKPEVFGEVVDAIIRLIRLKAWDSELSKYYGRTDWEKMVRLSLWHEHLEIEDFISKVLNSDYLFFDDSVKLLGTERKLFQGSHLLIRMLSSKTISLRIPKTGVNVDFRWSHKYWKTVEYCMDLPLTKDYIEDWKSKEYKVAEFQKLPAFMLGKFGKLGFNVYDTSTIENQEQLCIGDYAHEYMEDEYDDNLIVTGKTLQQGIPVPRINYALGYLFHTMIQDDRKIGGNNSTLFETLYLPQLGDQVDPEVAAMLTEIWFGFKSDIPGARDSGTFNSSTPKPRNNGGKPRGNQPSDSDGFKNAAINIAKTAVNLTVQSLAGPVASAAASIAIGVLESKLTPSRTQSSTLRLNQGPYVTEIS